MSFEKFKLCNACKTWLAVDDILYSPEIEPIGMTVLSEDSDTVFFYFIHNTATCGSSFLIDAEELAPFINELALSPNSTGAGPDRSSPLDPDDPDATREDSRYAHHQRFLHQLTQYRKLQPAGMFG